MDHEGPDAVRERRAPPDRSGERGPRFDPEFLGVHGGHPAIADVQAAASVELAYEHFTVVLDTQRRFAA